jgi:hypothetical protein
VMKKKMMFLVSLLANRSNRYDVKMVMELT